MRSWTKIALLGFLAALAAPAAGAGPSVYLNGVNIDGVTDARFEKATVRIDAKGNVFIDAPGYVARVVGAEPAPPAGRPPAVTSDRPPGPRPTRITQRYFLVASQNEPGMAEFEFDVYVNAKWLMKLRRDLDQQVHDVTRHLRPGENRILIQAHKVSEGPRRSFSAGHAYTVVLGEGNEGGGNVMIDNPLLTFKRTAADAESTSREFVIHTR